MTQEAEKPDDDEATGEPDQPSPRADAAADAADSEATPAEPAPAVTSAAQRRDAQFRFALLAKLPRLAYAAWDKNDFKIEDELGTAVNLRADAILAPLEPLAPQRMR